MLAAVSVLAAGLRIGLADLLGAPAGLTRTFTPGAPTEPGAAGAVTRVTRYVGIDSLSKVRRIEGLSADGRYTWTGVWRVDTAGSYRFDATTRHAVAMTIDDQMVIRSEGGDHADVSIEAERTMTPGVHAISIAYDAAEPDRFAIRWAVHNEPLRPLSQADLYPDARASTIARVLSPIWWLAVFTAAGAVVAGLASAAAWASTSATGAALVIVLALASLARLDGLVSKWHVVPGPSWFVAGQEALARGARLLHPLTPSLPHERYDPGGDPYDYLQQAREDGSLFSAGLREPLFPFVEALSLRLFGEADESGLITSALFSWLLVLATYMLGAAAGSPTAGVIAAFGLAIERNVVDLGVSGYRDDAFAALVVLLTWATLRLAQRPDARRAIIWGVLAGSLCLIRLTALSVVVPLFVLLALDWSGLLRLRRRSAEEGIEPTVRRPARTAAIAAAAVLAVAGPYLIACWIEYGTPIYAISGLRQYWPAQATEQASAGWSSYVFGPLVSAPVAYVDDMFMATLAAFQNKWDGFAGVSAPAMITALQLLSLAGMLSWCWSKAGWYLLVALATSLAPFVFIFGIKPDGHQYRYTLHAYPFALLAAAMVVTAVAAYVAQRVPGNRRTRWADRRFVWRLAVTTAVAVAGWCAAMALPLARQREELRASGRAIVAAGARDLLFFRRDWDAPVQSGNVIARCADTARPAVWVPMNAGRDATLVLRLDTCAPGDPEDQLVVRVNGTPAATFRVRHDADRFGSYTVRVPGGRVRSSLNRVDLATDSGSPHVRLWYVQVITER